MISKISVVSPPSISSVKVVQEDLLATKKLAQKRSSALDLINMFRAQKEARKIKRNATSSLEMPDIVESCESPVKSRANLEPPKPKISPIVRQKSFNVRSQASQFNF